MGDCSCTTPRSRTTAASSRRDREEDRQGATQGERGTQPSLRRRRPGGVQRRSWSRRYPRLVTLERPGPAARIAELRAQIERANRLYYEQDAPEIADAEYDALMRELGELETAHPGLVTPDSPTQRVGGAPAAPLSGVRHSTRWRALANAFSHDELRAFDARVRK